MGAKKNLFPESQAGRIIFKLGGVVSVSKMLNVTRQSVYKWTWELERGGSGGLIPTAALKRLCLAARLNGHLLTADDLDPRQTKTRKKAENET